MTGAMLNSDKALSTVMSFRGSPFCPQSTVRVLGSRPELQRYTKVDSGPQMPKYFLVEEPMEPYFYSEVLEMSR